MSSKIGLLISLMFFTMFFMLSIDMMCIQYQYSDLDSQSVVIAYEVSHLESITDENVSHIEEKHHVVIVDISNRNPEFGDVIDIVILREYKPIIVSNSPMEIKIKRSVVIGYY